MGFRVGGVVVAAVAAVAASGCIANPATQPCGDVICPADAVCLEGRSLCVPAGVAGLCGGKVDGDPCSSADIVEGNCDGGLCQAAVCGDDRVSGAETCDGVVDHGCGDFGFYAGAVACSPTCALDLGGCSGSCGDHIVQFEDGEDCDGPPPIYHCTDVGYDYGHLACTDRCGDTARTDCGVLGIPTLFEAPAGTAITDAWRDGSLFVAALGPDGIIVQDHGTTTTTAGRFGTIAAHEDLVATSAGTAVYRIVNGALVQILPGPPFSSTVPESFTAYDSDGTLWLVTGDGSVASLANGVWTLQQPLAGTVTALQIDGGNNLYTIVDAKAYRHTTAGWIPLTTTGTPRALADGGGDTTFVLTTAGIEPFTAGAHATTIGNLGRDALGTPGGILVATPIGTLERIAADPPTALTSVDAPTRLRSLRDGRILAWGARVYELDPLSTNLSSGYSTLGSYAAPSGRMLFWGDADYLRTYDFVPITTAATLIYSVAADAGDTLYIAAAEGVVTGKTTFTTDATVHPRVIWSDPAGNVAAIELAAIKLRAAGASTWTTLPSIAPCVPQALAGIAVDDLYVEARCADHDEIIRIQGNGMTTVKMLATSTDAQKLGNGVSFRDGTMAFATTATVAIGKGTDWTILPTGATAISGTAATDVWITGAHLSPVDPITMAHWDSVTLAPVRSPLTHLLTTIAVTKQSVVLGARDQRAALVRWRGP